MQILQRATENTSVKESFADYMILNEISKDIDSYRYSTFFYKNHILNDGLMHLGPAWDYNFGMGNVNFGTEGAQFTKKWNVQQRR